MKKAEHPCTSRVEKVSGLRINVTFTLQFTEYSIKLYVEWEHFFKDLYSKYESAQIWDSAFDYSLFI